MQKKIFVNKKVNFTGDNFQAMIFCRLKGLNSSHNL